MRNSFTSWSAWFICLKLWEIFHIQFCLVFIKLFFSTTTIDTLNVKRLHSFQTKYNGKATHSFTPRPLAIRNFKMQWYLHELELLKIWPGAKLNLENQSFEYVAFFSIVTFNLLRSHILKWTCSLKLQVYLSRCDLFVTTRH